ncbi:MAG TPA: UvrD-helicase domain-containing protein [Oligoflexia bacterium]|nr:UvrD-helicase domain-containing protein [Oligoflexia bacterium]HMP26875.1 UvrD-helicase domain-containing protein [Oligoflexia bacterium]
MDILEEKLNSEQLLAARHATGPLLILAGAGSGKTRVLTYRVFNLITNHKVAPAAIMAITFTNKAAGEMKDRLFALLGRDASKIWISTFHSAAARILRRHAAKLGYTNDFAIYDEDDSRSLLKLTLKELDLDPKKNSAGFYSRAIDFAKNNLKTPEHFSSKAYSTALIGRVYASYQEKLLKANAMDFGDLLLNLVALLKSDETLREYYQSSISHLLVDEYQDTNSAQLEFVRLISAKHKNVMVVGDEDQSIYSFRGADIQNILKFQEHFPDAEIVRLEQNYRSTGNILKAADKLIAPNKARLGKKLWTASGDGDPIAVYVGYNEEAEAAFVSARVAEEVASGVDPSQIGIFYRINAQSRALEEALLARGLPYRIYGAIKFYERKEIKDIIAYLKFITNPQDIQSLLRIINFPPRGIGATTIEKITSVAKKTPLDRALSEVASQNRSVQSFLTLLNRFQEKLHLHTLDQFIESIIELSGYRALLKEDRDPQAQARFENLLELLSLARKFKEENNFNSARDCLLSFLDRVSLAQSADIELTSEGVVEQNGKPNKAVSLMTLHLAKGLEFDSVYLTGLEDGLLPHSRSLASPEEIEEERRLVYVGVTRAKERLYLTRARYRGLFSSGGGFTASPYRLGSRFLSDLPREVTCAALKDGNVAEFFQDIFDNLSDLNLQFDENFKDEF